MLDALGVPTGSPGRSLDGSPGGGPDKHSFAQEKSVSSPAPQALALAAPEDRPRSEPTRPEKRWEDTPYKNREGEAKTQALTLNGGTPETEAAVANGLAYLARIQRANGGWGDSEESDGKYGQIAIGKTGLALLAFLGAGHTHVSNTPYSENAARAISFLLAMQDENSGHFGDSEAYSHGIATYALGECYALTGEPELRAPLEKAVAHILAKQNHARDPKRFGGWSYYYQDDRVYDRWPRTSITVWQVMALESARLGGLTVPGQVFDDAATFIGNAEDPDEGWYRYNHDPARLNSAYPTLPASTPAALFALSLVGRDINSAEHAKTREFVLSRAPRGYRRGSEDEFVRLGQGNLYFWYYGTLSMFRAGGNAWQRWNTAMKDTLVNGQRKDGSWAPIDVYCSYARDDERDRSYSTAMCVLSLEVYYRYYLPLLKIR
jgi:prenyltransferase/squalene oxidase-like repeat protein